ncbi:hypothetical protein [Spiroplasma endosymbiont of Diplazon laetatorius]|uniref:hypothetical protein n=1 Tax=Spiroplasma endosymbiont of Diplazon laetatorius TaxID=3066322 RepID=UPI0030CD18BC
MFLDILIISFLSSLFILGQEIVAIIFCLLIFMSFSFKSIASNPSFNSEIKNVNFQKQYENKKIKNYDIAYSNYNVSKLLEWSIKIYELKENNRIFSSMIEKPKEFIELFDEDFVLVSSNGDRLDKYSDNYVNIFWYFLLDSNISTNVVDSWKWNTFDEFKIQLRDMNDIDLNNPYKWMLDLQFLINNLSSYEPIEDDSYIEDLGLKTGPKGYDVRKIYKLMIKNLNILSNQKYGSSSLEDIAEIRQIIMLSYELFLDEFTNNKNIHGINWGYRTFSGLDEPNNAINGYKWGAEREIYSNKTSISYGNNEIYSGIMQMIALSKNIPNMNEFYEWSEYNIFSNEISNRYIKSTRLNYYFNPYASINYISNFGFYTNPTSENINNRSKGDKIMGKGFLANNYIYFDYKNKNNASVFDLERNDWEDGTLKVVKKVQIISPWLIYFEWILIDTIALFLSYRFFKKKTII